MWSTPLITFFNKFIKNSMPRDGRTETNMKKYLSTLLLLALLLPAIAGCTPSNLPNQTTAPSVSEPTEAPSDTPTEIPTEVPTEIPTEAPTDSEEITTEQTEPPVQEVYNNNAYGEAYYIFESYTNVREGNLPNGWSYDNRFDLTNTSGAESYKLSDSSDEQFFALTRDFAPESDGILRLELLIGFASQNGGAYISFVSKDGNTVIEVTEQNGYFAIIGKTTVTTDIPVPTSGETQHAFTIDVDLDSNTASVIINNKVAGEVEIDDKAVLSQVALGTKKIGGGNITLLFAELNKNYPLSDGFMIPSNAVGQKPSHWNITGNFKYDYIPSEIVDYHDLYSVKADSKAGSKSTASKSFGSIYGKISFETYILLPEKVDGASVALTSGGNEILKFETKDGKIVIGDTVLHDYAANVWQCLHIDADTETGIATVYINGKKRANVTFNAESFDGVSIEFAPETDAVMWFDDVVLYNLFDYADYPTYPQVAESTDYNVGINVCWLWRDSNSGEGWDVASGFPELRPYLGFYDEGLRETADWEIKYMAEHGIDFMNVCWYSPGHDVQVPIKKMYRSYSALHDGYMYAKYSDLVKFCILWENDTRGFTNFEQFRDITWAYWKEYYLCDDRYMRLDNKAIITVWSKDLLTTMFGGEDELSSAIEFMEQELIEMGYDGLILLFTTQGRVERGTYGNTSGIGYDGSYAYHYGSGGYDPQLQMDLNKENVENAISVSSHHVPTISVGFNSLPRHGTRYPLISPADHLAVCEDVKDILSGLNTGTWKDNTVMISTWNEYTEGTYIFPTEGIGFSYLENIRKAFTNDTSDHSEIDVKPTEAQVDRVTHMFPDDRSSVSWYNYEPNDDDKALTDYSSYEVVREFNSTEWAQNHNVTRYSNTNGIIEGVSNNHDFGIIFRPTTPINADDVSLIHIRMQSDKKGDIELFFTTSDNASFDSSRSSSNTIKSVGKMEDYYFVVSANSEWAGEITSIRLDPGTVGKTSFKIELIEFLKKPESTTPKLHIYINHTEYLTGFNPVLLESGDYEVVASRTSGFYALMLFYHEWNLNDQTLTIRTQDEKTYVFTVGSDKVVIDGREKRLGYTFTLRDGLPVFRIKSLCSLFGYKVTHEGNALMIQSCSDKEYAALSTEQSAGTWNFNLPNSIDGWTGQNSTIGLSDNGTLVVTPTNSDPAILKTVSFNASEYNTIKVGIRYFEGLEDMQAPNLFFLTNTDYTFDGLKSVSAKYNIPEGVRVGDTVEVVFDLFTCGYWNGIITYLRVDAINMSENVHEIDYIKLLNLDHGDEQKAEAGVWEFENEGDIGGWLSQNITLEARGNGFLSASPQNSDPAIYRQLYTDAGRYSQVIIGVKYYEGIENEIIDFFFTNPSDNCQFTGTKTIRSSYIVPEGTKVGDIVYATFDVAAHPSWTGIIDFIRLDTVASTSVHEIDVIKLVK